MSAAIESYAPVAANDPMASLLQPANFNDYLDSRLCNMTGVAVLLIDVDHLGELNNALGHDVGDEILREMARRLRFTSGPRNTPARLGGDRFAIVINCDDRDEADTAALSALRLLGSPMNIKGKAVTASVSIGVARARVGSSPQSLLDEADEALRAAKKAGGRVWRVAPIAQPQLHA